MNDIPFVFFNQTFISWEYFSWCPTMKEAGDMFKHIRIIVAKEITK